MLDPLKRADFIKHVIKEEKNQFGWCWMKYVPEQIFHTTLSWIQNHFEC